MHPYQVGKPYHPDRKIWPPGVQFNFRGGELELVLFFDSPTESEVAAVEKSTAEFALFVDTSAVKFTRLAESSPVILCYRFEPGIPWKDAPFSYHTVPEHQRVPPPDDAKLQPETRALLHIVLVNATGGEVRARQTVSLSPEFTKELYRAIGRHAARPWDQAVYNRRLDEIHQRYPTTEALVAACGHRTCRGD